MYAYISIYILQEGRPPQRMAQARRTATGTGFTRKEGDPLQVANWYQACFEAGLPVTVQVNESRD